MPKPFRTIVAIGDQHLPFLHKPTWQWIVWMIEQIRPAFVTFGGDLYDMYAFNRFGRRLRFTAQDEVQYARAQMEEMLAMLFKVLPPSSKVFLLKGNHDERAAKRMQEKMDGEWEAIAQPKDLWTFPKVETVHDPRAVLVIQDIRILHGYKTKPGDHLKDLEFHNCIVHHTHRGGVFCHRVHSGEVRSELNAGYIADPFSPELVYRPLLKYFAWTHGLGVWDYWGPRFIPRRWHASDR